MSKIRVFVIQKILFPLMRIYWRVFRPRTFGVKAVVVRPEDSSVLLVRHSYGDTSIWSLPGGGYKPRRESPQAAVAREIHEELGLRVSTSSHLGEYKTQAQGKRDTVAIFLCQVEAATITKNSELAEARWFSPAALQEIDKLYTITRRALELYRESIASHTP